MSAGTSAHTLQAHRGNPSESAMILRDNTSGSCRGDSGKSPLPAPPTRCLVTCQMLCGCCHPHITSQLPEAVALAFPLSARCHPVLLKEVLGEETHHSYTAPFSTWPQAAPLWTLVPWNIPGCLPGGHRCHLPSLLFGAQPHRDHGCGSWRLRGCLKSEGVQMAMQSLATSAVTCPSTS